METRRKSKLVVKERNKTNCLLVNGDASGDLNTTNGGQVKFKDRNRNRGIYIY